MNCPNLSLCEAATPQTMLMGVCEMSDNILLSFDNSRKSAKRVEVRFAFLDLVTLIVAKSPRRLTSPTMMNSSASTQKTHCVARQVHSRVRVIRVVRMKR